MYPQRAFWGNLFDPCNWYRGRRGKDFGGDVLLQLLHLHPTSISPLQPWFIKIIKIIETRPTAKLAQENTSYDPRTWRMIPGLVRSFARVPSWQVTYLLPPKKKGNFWVDDFSELPVWVGDVMSVSSHGRGQQKNLQQTSPPKSIPSRTCSRPPSLQWSMVWIGGQTPVPTASPHGVWLLGRSSVLLVPVPVRCVGSIGNTAWRSGLVTPSLKT